MRSLCRDACELLISANCSAERASSSPNTSHPAEEKWGENKAYRYHLLGKSYASSKRHITNLFLAQELDASDRIEFDRSLGQINSELDRLNVLPRETIEPDRWSEELQAIGWTLNEIDNSE